MFSRIYNIWQIIKGSLWFVPMIVCTIYFLSTVLTYVVETKFFDDPELSALFYNGTTDDAKALIGPLISSMITMATLAISITMVVLSLAASQLGPRIIKSFMSDRRTQIYIGMFLGAVVACFALTRILHDEILAAQTPSLTISLVFAFCFINLFILLAFVHHVAQSSIADSIIIRLNDSLMRAIDKLSKRADKDKKYTIPKNFDDKKQSLAFTKSGYIQTIDYNNLIDIASENELVIELPFKAGKFVVNGEDSLYAWPEGRLNDEIKEDIIDSFVIGNFRTPTQDIEYPVRHLVEIAIRALSPGINDNFTAMTVLDHLSSALSYMFYKTVPHNAHFDKDKKLCIFGTRDDETKIIYNAFTQIRQSAEQKADVTEHLLLKIRILRLYVATTKKSMRSKNKSHTSKIILINILVMALRGKGLTKHIRRLNKPFQNKV